MSKRKPGQRPSGWVVPETPPATALTLAALDALTTDAVHLFHRLTAAAEQIHRQGEMTAAKRGVLRGLDRVGPQTVPQMARARPVSRQFIQTLVNQLAEQGHVEFIDNPAHKRSRLVRLTPRGKELLEAMYRREAKALGQLEIGIPDENLRAAAAVLRAVRELFQSEQWKKAVESIE